MTNNSNSTENFVWHLQTDLKNEYNLQCKEQRYNYSSGNLHPI